MVQMAVKANVGDSGYAEARLTKNTVRLTFRDSGITYDLPVELWKTSDGSPVSAGEFNVTLSRDNQKIVGIKPIAGTYVFEFDSIGNRINEIPEPAIMRGGPRQSKDGKKRWFQPDSMVWRPVLRVMSEGKYEGLKVQYMLPYIFSSVPGTPNTQLLGESRRDLEQVEGFFRAVGFDLINREIPYSVNVLPWLETTLKNVNTPFLAKVNEKGYVSDPSVLPADLAPRKKAPKGKK
jgi:hypothetical protein